MLPHQSTTILPFLRAQAQFIPIALLLVVLVCRFVTLGSAPILDPSEGRYSTIAQNMVLTGDWITPLTFDDGDQVPFLGKPPLSFWLTALSFKAFGFTELASRFPSFIALLFLTAGLYHFCATLFSREIACFATLIFVSSLVTFFFAGACMLDPWLATSVGGAVIALTLFLRTPTPKETATWGYLFFISLALGLLCKGPVAIVLTMASVGPWLLVEKQYRKLSQLPWIHGLALTTALTAPWYFLVEMYNPGFLRYFLINENILRFLVKEYGDRYGSGHQHPMGMIWLMLLGAFMPGSILFGWMLWMSRPLASVRATLLTPTAILVASWGLAPCIFFTVGRQVSIYYVLPGIPGLSVIIALMLQKLWHSHPLKCVQYFFVQSCITRVLAFATVATMLFVRGDFISAALSLLALGVCEIIFAPLFPRSTRAASTKEDQFLFFGAATLSLVLFFSIAQVMQVTALGGNVSSKDVVSYLETLPEISHITFLGNIPHSSYLYSRDGNNDHLSLSSTDDPASDWQGALVMSKRRLKKMAEGDRAALEEKKMVGGWVVFAKKARNA
jgi:4-amino-4-deoxy-L-arabinose transferase-like glycosyltransferase